ncbi:MAG: dockerin type I repeat-containing protein, partial [Prevotella sp.]|nr:dockerin type I repeat-containing protein [Prevotella sp.]
LTLPNTLKGDANGDGYVNAADIVEVVNYIMGYPSEKFDEILADANNDGTVNAADIVTIVNYIMAVN